MTPILSNNYYVYFEKSAYQKINGFILETEPSKIFILVDENTEKHCLPIFLNYLETNKKIEIISIISGEEYKNLDACNIVWNQLTDLNADRKSLLINLGGGVITDLGGFVASTFKRGIDFINIPTTLLSMVDASVGGKTGVDLGVLKNQIGLFADPKMVIIDVCYLETLSEREMISGLAEIIKYGLTFDKSIIEDVNALKSSSEKQLNNLVYRSIQIKNKVVTEDPYEKSLRKTLNFGHTLGHAIESYFLDSTEKEKLTHGEAIAVGMIAELYISKVLLGFPEDELSRIKSMIFEIFGKVQYQQSDYEGVLANLIHDKKNVGGKVNFVLLNDIEDFKIDVNASKQLIIEALDYYLN